MADVDVTNSVPIDVFVTNSETSAPTYRFVGSALNRIQARMVYVTGQRDCQNSFGPDAKVANAKEIREAIVDGFITDTSLRDLGLVPNWGSGADNFGKAYFTPDDSISATMFWINSYGKIYEKRIGENHDLYYTAVSCPMPERQ